MNITHLDAQNRPQMIDVSAKEPTLRSATASGKIAMSRAAFDAVKNNMAKKGPVLQTAIIAAICGAKKTGDLIPMCHPLAISHISCDIKEDEQSCVFTLFTTVKLNGQTGVEMEALTGVTIGLLTIYDMLKAIDKTMVISDIKLQSKSGGKSGEFTRSSADEK
ncbi:MAG: cyclic pyranopterin monophosphate synthase MoaC [Helicobacteraceae bacterium]|jgi:cyclic pyranopterin phosphate synthase|nr:cyclic pyranopterin monophosphate synthase MoaC [Helicobacteraceae bacterium]